jgi:hypothetical protein
MRGRPGRPSAAEALPCPADAGGVAAPGDPGSPPDSRSFSRLSLARQFSAAHSRTPIPPFAPNFRPHSGVHPRGRTNCSPDSRPAAAVDAMGAKRAPPRPKIERRHSRNSRIATRRMSRTNSPNSKRPACSLLKFQETGYPSRVRVRDLRNGPLAVPSDPEKRGAGHWAAQRNECVAVHCKRILFPVLIVCGMRSHGARSPPNRTLSVNCRPMILLDIVAYTVFRIDARRQALMATNPFLTACFGTASCTIYA